MAEEKYCPLTYAIGKGAYDQEISNFDYCKKEDCSWWDDFAGHCAILSISRHGAEGSFDVVKKERE